MTKHSKTAVAVIGIIILSGGLYFIFKYLKGTKGHDQPPLPPDQKSSLLLSAVASKVFFPLKKGSKNQFVAQLQNALIEAYGKAILPKYGADGDWGTELDAAVKAKLGVSEIATQAELSTLITKMKSSATAAANTAIEYNKASQLLNSFNANKNLRLMVIVDTSAPIVKLDYQGVVSQTGIAQIIKANEPLSRSSYSAFKVLTNGMLVVKMGTDKYCIFRPSTTTLI